MSSCDSVFGTGDSHIIYNRCIAIPAAAAVNVACDMEMETTVVNSDNQNQVTIVNHEITIDSDEEEVKFICQVNRGSCDPDAVSLSQVKTEERCSIGDADGIVKHILGEDVELSVVSEIHGEENKVTSDLNKVSGEGDFDCLEEIMDDDCGDQGINPLLVDVVFHDVLQYVDLKNLNTCRLVCVEWAKASWEYMMQKNIFKFTKSNVTNLIEFLSSLSATRVSYPVKLDFRGFKVVQHRAELLQLCKVIGSSVKELTLKFQDQDLCLEDLESIFLMNFPNLEYLALDSLPCDFFRGSQDSSENQSLSNGQIPQLLKLKTLKLGSRCHYGNNLNEEFFINLLRLCPNLEKLEGLVEWSAPKLVEALDILHLQKLVHLVLRGAFNETTARILEKFQLKTLYLAVSGHYNHDNDHNVIYQQRGTLETLGLGWSSFKSRIQIENLQVQFPFLTSLSLCDSSKWAYDICPKKYTIGEGIKKLRADIRMPTDFQYLDKNLQAFQKVNELDVCFMSRSIQISESGLRSMIIEAKNLFPVLRILTLHIGYSFPVRHIFLQFPELEELTLIYDKSVSREHFFDPGYLDSAMTGIGETWCLNYRSATWNCTFIPESEARALGEISKCFVDPVPLSNLKRLRKLSIMGDTFNISHVTVYACMLRMKHLTSIRIKPATANVYKILKDNLSPAVYLDIVTG